MHQKISHLTNAEMQERNDKGLPFWHTLWSGHNILKFIVIRLTQRSLKHTHDNNQKWKYGNHTRGTEHWWSGVWISHHLLSQLHWRRWFKIRLCEIYKYRYYIFSPNCTVLWFRCRRTTEVYVDYISDWNSIWTNEEDKIHIWDMRHCILGKSKSGQMPKYRTLPEIWNGCQPANRPLILSGVVFSPWL